MCGGSVTWPLVPPCASSPPPRSHVMFTCTAPAAAAGISCRPLLSVAPCLVTMWRDKRWCCHDDATPDCPPPAPGHRWRTRARARPGRTTANTSTRQRLYRVPARTVFPQDRPRGVWICTWYLYYLQYLQYLGGVGVWPAGARLPGPRAQAGAGGGAQSQHQVREVVNAFIESTFLYRHRMTKIEDLAYLSSGNIHLLFHCFQFQ